VAGITQHFEMSGAAVRRVDIYREWIARRRDHFGQVSLLFDQREIEIGMFAADWCAQA